ncbi:hypothetical protein GCM10027259_60980 [Micromonospora palomenae]|nr:hypothetical protein [Micromonospora palomenae]
MPLPAAFPAFPAVTGGLYTTLSDLRRTIGAVAVHHRDDRYRLDPDHVDVDLWRLRAAAQHAATVLTDHTGTRQKVIDAYTR